MSSKFSKMMHMENNLDRLVKKHVYIENQVQKNMKRCSNKAKTKSKNRNEEMVATYQTLEEINQENTDAIEVIDNFKMPVHKVSYRAKQMHKAKYTPTWKNLADYSIRSKEYPLCKKHKEVKSESLQDSFIEPKSNKEIQPILYD